MKLKDLGFPDSLNDWILDFLLQRCQEVRVGNHISQPLILNTGTPQGCPISPKLYNLFTYDCATEDQKRLIVKFADDTTAAGLISHNDETNYRAMVSELAEWCDNNNLLLNVTKTKEMVIDFKTNKSPIEPLAINGKEVEQVEDFKFLGCNISNKLQWSEQIRKI